MKKYITLILCILSPLLWRGAGGEAFAQKKKQMEAKDKLKLADQLYEAGSYYNAIDFYNEVAVEQPKDVYVANQLAELYFATRDYKNSEIWFQKTMKLDAVKYPFAQFKYAMSLKMEGKYELAKTEFTAVSKGLENLGEKGTEYKKTAKNEIAACDFAMKAMKNPLPIKVENLNTEVNAAYSDFAAVPQGDLLVYSSLRSDSVIMVDNKRKEKYLTQIFQVKKNGNQFSERTAFPPTINDGESHNGNGTFSMNGKKFYFTRCNVSEENPNKLICAIYASEIKDGVLQEAVELPAEINNEKYTSTHPSIGTDGGGKEILYFSSDRDGGQGGMDLWYSQINKDGTYKEPVNLGKKINTSRNEVTPFYDRKLKTLYFSSDGLLGLGGYDIFKSEGTLKKMTPSENVGSPLNSSVDDMYFTLEKTGKGYLTSNRIGSISLKSETCCDDVFRFEWFNIINVAVRGYVFEVGDSTKTPIEGATVSLYSLDKETKENVVISTATTTKNEMYFFDLGMEKEYKLSASKQGFFSGKGLFLEYAEVNTMGMTKSDTLRADMYLQRMKKNVGYVLKNIYYDFDKATLRAESTNSLDSLLMLLNEHPEIKIELGSHTDSKGSDEYNKKLSQKRAESVIAYLITNKISKERLVAKGYGESQPVAMNENPDGTDNPEGRQLNRRTEFKIIGEVPVTVLSEEIPEEMKVKKK